MENYNASYLNNSFGHEFNENFVENFQQHEQHQSKSDFEIPLQETMFGYDGIGISTNNQVSLYWIILNYENGYHQSIIQYCAESTSIVNYTYLFSGR